MPKLTEAVHVDLRVNGEDFTGTYGPGEVELPEPVAQVLAEQGLLDREDAAPDDNTEPAPDDGPDEVQDSTTGRGGRRGRSKTTTIAASTEA